jgi:alpha-tubulin suppressor-like RCC1 family protein
MCRLVVSLVALSWLVAGCDSSKKVDLGGECSLNSECNSPLVCTFGKCHAACVQTRDCPLGQSCVMTAGGSVCQLPEEVDCRTMTCAAPAICAVDNHCRTVCQTAANCTLGQVCVSSVCADTADLDPNGQLPGSPKPDSGVDAVSCPVGTETCPCYGNDTCNAGLTCASHLCVGMGGTGGSIGRDAGAGAGGAGGSVGVDGGVSAPDSGAGGAPGSDAAMSAVAQMALGWGEACAVRSDGTLWCWGRNEWGQAGDGTACSPYPCGKSRPVQVAALGNGVVEVAAGAEHVCARRSDGTLWCWGWGVLGQLGQGTQAKNSSSVPLETVLGSNVAQVAAGFRHSCARKNDGTLWCWGVNDNGELGNGTTMQTGYGVGTGTPVQVAALGSNVLDVVAGGNHTCARKTDGTLWCWGENDHGELGNGTTDGQTCPSGSACQSSPVQVTALGANVVEVAAGYNHTCARKSDGTLWCWGSNANGQLGDGTLAGQIGTDGYPCRPSPVQVSALGTSVVEVAAGGGYYAGYLGHTCARKSDGTLWCWGSNVVGQLGDGTTGGQICVAGYACLPSPAQVSWMCPSHPQSDADGYACDPSPKQVTALGTGVVEVEAGALNTCARKSDGTLWCWGANAYAQIGDGTTDGQTCYDSGPCKPSPTPTALTPL